MRLVSDLPTFLERGMYLPALVLRKSEQTLPTLRNTTNSI
jgi:hypothetical protein